MTTAWIVAFASLAALVCLLGLIEIGTLRRIAPLLERAAAIVREDLAPRGISPGFPVPRFTADLRDGALLDNAELLGAPYVVLFLSGGCRGCDSLIREVVQGRTLDVKLIVVVNDFDDLPELPLTAEAGITIVRQDDHSVARSFQTTATPHAFVINSAGRISARDVVNSFAALQRLVDDSLDRTPHGLRITNGATSSAAPESRDRIGLPG